MKYATTKKLKFHIKTWGCQLNYSDTASIQEILNDQGIIESENINDADLIILNTCSVRQRAEDKVSGLGKQFKRLKQSNPNLKIIMTGCMSQRVDRSNSRDDCDCNLASGKKSQSATNKQKDNEIYDMKYQQRLRARFDWIDHFIHIGDLESLQNVVKKDFGVEFMDKAKNDEVAESSKINTSVTALVHISKGCNNFCTYCIVPFTRGKEESRSSNEILDEVRGLVQNGCKLITLLGQNVNSWEENASNSERQKPLDFPYLLNEVCKIEGDFWVTFLTSHPKDFSKRLINVMCKNEKICKYLNLPIQSGSNNILKKMNRKYTWMEYTEKINNLLEKIPDIRLSTDIIVGFPGESEDDFMDTYLLVKKIGFSMAYVSEYSPRPGSASTFLKDNVTREEKKRRKEKVVDAITEIIEENNVEAIGREERILVVDKGRGQTFDLRDVILKGRGWKVGEFSYGKIVDGNAKGLVAELISESKNSGCKK